VPRPDEDLVAAPRRATVSQPQHDPRPAAPPPTARPDRPGWPEVLLGLAVLAVVAYGTALYLLDLVTLAPVGRGLVVAALSGVAGILGFLAAWGLRIRAFAAFGVRRTTPRWLLIGVGGGLLAFAATRVIGLVIGALGVRPEDVQTEFTDAGSGGIGSLVLSMLFLAVLTPLGEELTYRGVVASALLRYGALVGVVGSALVFAVMHGPNVIFFASLVVGLITGELRRRSGSVWPGVVTHGVNNALALLVALVVAGVL
jgi:membrane protease YdiL (CAAX protease family)